MSKAKILFVSANAPGDDPLDIEREQSLVAASVAMAKRRDHFEVVLAPGIRPDGCLTRLSNEQPSVVHFSGHGSESGVIFRDSSAPVSGQQLARALKKRQVRLVVLNACFSLDQAKAINAVVPSVVGTTRDVRDEDALGFS